MGKGFCFFKPQVIIQLMEESALEKTKRAVFARQKTLALIYERHGRLRLADYAKTWQTQPVEPENLVARLLEKNLGRIYGKDLAVSVTKQFLETGLVSTIDHHGLFGHPFFLNSNLIFSLKPGIKYLPVLSTSGVSLNNSSWPGCLVLTSPKDRRLIKLSFFNDEQKTGTVFKSAAISNDRLLQVAGRVSRLDFLTAGQKERFRGLFEKVFKSEDFGNFSDQACSVSHKIWREIFPTAPELVYFPLEDLVSGILEEAICTSPKHILHRLLFTGQGWSLLEKHFNGVRGAFGGGRGSFLFWGLDAKGRRFAFIRQNGSLSGLDVSLALKPEQISAALAAREIYPTSLMCFLVLLYYKVTCLGGFNQTTWLTEIKNKFAVLLAEMGEKEAALAVAGLETGNFAEGSLAILKNSQGYFKASALDLFLNSVGYPALQKLAHKVTLAQSIEAELPEVYRIVVPEKEREAHLAGGGLDKILEINGLKETLVDF